MKKIIFMLLVLFCGMGLFAEDLIFYTGSPFVNIVYDGPRGDWGDIQFIFNTFPMNISTLGPVKNKNYILTYDFVNTIFTKIIPVGDDFFEVELFQNEIYYKYQVKKGDYLEFFYAIFGYHGLKNDIDDFQFGGTLTCYIKDIHPNKITIEIKPTN